MRHHRYLWGAAFVALASAAIAADFSMLREAVVKVSRQTLDGYSFDAPAGAENDVPTIFVWSDNKVSYGRTGAGKIPLKFHVRARQQCTGEWEQHQLPFIYVGDQHWPGDGAGKPILQQEGHEYAALLQVQLDKVEFAPGFSRDQAIQRCNLVVAGHAKDGKLPADLLREGFWIKVDNAVRASIKPGCVDRCDKKVGFCEDLFAGGEIFRLPVWLRCMPTGYVETHRLPPEPHRTKPEGQRLPGTFRSIDLEAVNSPLKHECPATVVFRGKIQSNRAVKGSYRFVGSDGYSTSAFPYSLPDNGEQSVSRQRRVELPAGTGGLTAAGGGIWPRAVNGWLQLEVTEDGPDARTHRSERASFRVDCLKPGDPTKTLRRPGG